MSDMKSQMQEVYRMPNRINVNHNQYPIAWHINFLNHRKESQKSCNDLERKLILYLLKAEISIKTDVSLDTMQENSGRENGMKYLSHHMSIEFCNL